MKSLVVFYSLGGSTKAIAEAVAQAISADVLELKTKEQIRGNAFTKHLWGGRQVVRREKPELFPFNTNPLDYDFLVIGTPVWAFTFTPAMRSFFNLVKLQNKKIALYCCSDGMPGKTIDNMKAELGGNEFVGGLRLAKTAQNKEKNINEAIEWIKKII